MWKYTGHDFQLKSEFTMCAKILRIQLWFKIFSAGQRAIYCYILCRTRSRYSKSGRWCRSIIPHTQSPSADKRTSRRLASLFTLHTGISSSFAVIWPILSNYIKEYICQSQFSYLCVCKFEHFIFAEFKQCAC